MVCKSARLLWNLNPSLHIFHIEMSHWPAPTSYNAVLFNHLNTTRITFGRAVMFLSDKWVKEPGDYDKNEIVVFMYINIYLFSSLIS